MPRIQKNSMFYSTMRKLQIINKLRQEDLDSFLGKEENY